MRYSIVFLAAIFLASCQNAETVTTSTAKIKPSHPQWISVAGGCFKMGETRIYLEEGPVHEACVTPFEIWSHEITAGEFAKFVKETDYVTRVERGWKADELGGPGEDLAPSSAVFVPPKNASTGVMWWKLVNGASWRYPQGPDGPKADLSAPVVHLTREDAQNYAAWVGARLPTEAEWEYAARGGLNGRLMSWAEAEEAALKDKANTWQGVFPVINSAEDGFAGLAPTGQYPPNGFGLYDMIGNAWEWTSSNYYPRHGSDELAATRPDGFDPAQGDVPVGVIKGGSYLCAKSYCYRYRPAARQGQDLIFGTSHVGFRIVR